MRDGEARTTRQAYNAWPAESDRPTYRAVADRLRQLHDAGRLARTGHGHRFAPYRYRAVRPGPETGEASPAVLS